MSGFAARRVAKSLCLSARCDDSNLVQIALSSAECKVRGNMANKMNRSHVAIRREKGKPDVRTHFPKRTASPVDAIRWCEADGYKVIGHEVIETTEDEKYVSTTIVTVQSKARALDVGTFKQVEDNSGCAHKFIVGPQRTIKNLLVGHCDACGGREVAVELDKAGNRTGRSWLIEYGSDSLKA